MNSQNNSLHEGDVAEQDDDRYIPKILVPIPSDEHHLVLTNAGKIWHWMKREPLIPIGIYNFDEYFLNKKHYSNIFM